MRVLGLIPARGGSKGVPRKNIKLLGGKPLLQYTAEAALAANGLSQVILSTDDEEIAEIGRQCGLDVPFMRPPELAEDETPTLPVVQHAVRWMETRGHHFDAVCLLQPTNPFRQAYDVDGCIDLFERSGADSVVSMLPVPLEYNPHWVYFRDQEGWCSLSTGEQTPIPRRQSLPPAFHREGSVYVTRRDVLIEQNSLYGQRVQGYLLESLSRINIDTLHDWTAAEAVLAGA
jgi:CMP-N,N'-diacetyllegionaminic acid synthase